MIDKPIITRFAPSPTGYLHLGHAYSALFAARAAAAEAGGRFLLRIENIDPVRCKPEFITAIFEDLRWLGLNWEDPVRLQSQHLADYQAALNVLREQGLLYPCFCTRREVLAESAAAGHAPHGPDGPVYPGTCRAWSVAERQERIARGEVHVWRLDVMRAVAEVGALRWHDRGCGEMVAKPEDFGDVVLARKDVPTSYHLSVTVDDHLQGITLVTRGEDLLRSTDIHRLLQALLSYETPEYHHHALLTDAMGKRFAKRDKALTLREMRVGGKTAAEVREMIT